jgi:hypothetical protein
MGAELGLISCFFTQPWERPSPNLTLGDLAWLLSGAGFCLRAQGRLTEAVLPMQGAFQTRVALGDWANAAVGANNLTELELALGEVAAAVRDGEQSVRFARSTKDAFTIMFTHAAYADALHQAGNRDAALGWFRAAEDLQAKRQPQYPFLYALWGFQYCDLLLADLERTAWKMAMQRTPLATSGQPVEKEHAGWKLADTDLKELHRVRAEVVQRAHQTLQWAKQNQSDFDMALDNLTSARATLYAALLTYPSFSRLAAVGGQLKCDLAVKGLRQAGDLTRVPLGLLTRACLRWLNNRDEVRCHADLDEAWELAERGPMRLHMADILLTRARLFHDLQALAGARKLIEQCGYHRRDGELADAEVALGAT